VVAAPSGLSLTLWVEKNTTSMHCFMKYAIHINYRSHTFWTGARGSVVGWGTMLQAGRSRVRVPMRWIFINWPNPSSRNMALGSTQPLTETSTRNVLWG
jgi:hypothetical protein